MSTKLVKILAVFAVLVVAPGTALAGHGHGGHGHGGYWHGGGYWRGGGWGWGGPNVYLDFGYPGYYAPDYYESPEECGWAYVHTWRYGHRVLRRVWRCW